MGQYQKALELLEQSLTISRKIGYLAGERNGLGNMANVYLAVGDFQKSLELSEQSLAISRKIGDLAGQGNSLGNMGVAYESQGQYQKALELHEQSLAISRKLDDLAGQGANLANMGSIQTDLGNYQKAFKLYEQSLTISRKLGDVALEAKILNNIAKVYGSLGQYPQSMELLDQSLAISKKIGDVSGQSLSLNNIAAVYQSAYQYQRALELYEQSLAISRKTGEVYHEIVSLNNIADLCLIIGEIQPVEKMVKEFPNAPVLGRLALLKSDFEGALINYREVLDLGQKSRNADILFGAHTGLGLAQEGLQDYKQAAQHFQEAVDLSEEIRDSLPPAQRKNFYGTRVFCFPRIAPYEGLSRVLLKINNTTESLKWAESTKARLFAETLSQRAGASTVDVPEDIVAKDVSVNGKLASMLTGLQKAREKNSKEAIESFEKQVKEARTERDAHVSKLRQDYPLFAATKYPEPMELTDSALRENEWVIEYEVTDSGVCIFLIRGKQIEKALFKPIERKELDGLLRKFENPLRVSRRATSRKS